MALMAHSGCEEVHLGPQRQNDGKEGGFGQLQQTCAKARTVVAVVAICCGPVQSVAPVWLKMLGENSVSHPDNKHHRQLPCLKSDCRF